MSGGAGGGNATIYNIFFFLCIIKLFQIV